MIVSDCFKWLYEHAGKSRRWSWVYRSSLWCYQQLKSLPERLSHAFRGAGSRVKLYYFAGCSNFGDRLNLDLMRYFNADFSPEGIRYANVLAIGSILEEALVTHARMITYGTPLYVLGSGFMLKKECDFERFNRPVRLCAVRGKLTLKRCEKILGKKCDEVALGDPGLLVKDIFSDVVKAPEYDVGIICHFHDKTSPLLGNVKLKKKTVSFIDVTLPTRDFVAAVSKCRFILSSALHGIICADSLNIPNKWMLLSSKVEGWGYKFKDYYSVFDETPEAIDVKSCVIDDDVIDRLAAGYVDKSEKIEAICMRLKDKMKEVLSDDKPLD